MVLNIYTKLLNPSHGIVKIILGRHLSLQSSIQISSKPIKIPAEVSISFSYPIRPRTSNSSSPFGEPQLSIKGKLGRLNIDVLRFVTFKFQSPETNRVLGANLSPNLLASPRTFALQQPSTVPQDTVLGPGLLEVIVDDFAQKKKSGIWNLTQALVANAVQGVTQGFTTILQLVGDGYTASLEDIPSNSSDQSINSKIKQRLCLRVGYSHPVLINLPDSDTFLSCEIPTPDQILLKGVDKQELGVLGAGIRKWRPPEPNNGRGIYMNGEVTNRNQRMKKK